LGRGRVVRGCGADDLGTIRQTTVAIGGETIPAI
jgi:hypothetical protein